MLLLALTLAAAPIDPVSLAIAGNWTELSKLIDAKKLPTGKPDALTTTRILACRAGKDELAAKLAVLGAQGTFLCLAQKRQWDALGKEVTSAPPMSRERADVEGLTQVLPLLAAGKQDPIFADLATRVAPELCPFAISIALDEGNAALGKKLAAKCPPTASSMVSSLKRACEGGSVATVLAWKELGAELTKPLEGTTCLHLAVVRGDAAITAMLLDANADVNAVAADAPMFQYPAPPAELNSVAGHAIAGGNPAVVKALLARGADFSKVTPLVDRLAVFPGASLGELPNTLKRDPALEKEPRESRLGRIAGLLHGDQRAVLVVGGGTTPEAAQKSLEGWQKVSPLVAKFFKVPAGFPLVTPSDAVPGLKPGFHVVLLAAGPEWQLTAFLPIINALRPGSAVRQVSWTPESGPALLSLTSDFDRQTSMSRKVKKSTLSMTALWKYGAAEVAATLYDPNGEFVSSAVGSIDFGRCSSPCSPIEFESEGSGFAASATGEFPACTTPDVVEVTARVLLKGERVEIKESSRRISKGECD